MSFSSDKDTALSYLHDLGFIPKIVNGERGFKVMLERIRFSATSR
jgi:sulfite reductase (ferredoxin)